MVEEAPDYGESSSDEEISADAGGAADVGGSANAGDSAAAERSKPGLILAPPPVCQVAPHWVTPLIRAVLRVGYASLPSTDSILDLDVGSLLKPDYIDHHIQWSQGVSEALVELRGLCVDISCELIGDDTEWFDKTLMMAAQHVKQLTIMKTRFEWLSAMSDLLQRHSGFFNHGGELYAGHQTLTLGYTQSAFRRIAVSYSSFMWLVGDHLEERLDDTVQEDATPLWSWAARSRKT